MAGHDKLTIYKKSVSPTVELAHPIIICFFAMYFTLCYEKIFHDPETVADKWEEGFGSRNWIHASLLQYKTGTHTHIKAKRLESCQFKNLPSLQGGEIKTPHTGTNNELAYRKACISHHLKAVSETAENRI